MQLSGGGAKTNVHPPTFHIGGSPPLLPPHFLCLCLIEKYLFRLAYPSS